MTDVPLFDDLPAGEPPTALPDDEQQWPHEPLRLRLLADLLRPLLRVGLAPLDVAAAVLDADEEWLRSRALSETEQVARWLAEQSAHPRYADERWTMLLDSEGNVDHAYAEARRRLSLPTPQGVAALDAAKAHLRQHHRDVG